MKVSLMGLFDNEYGFDEIEYEEIERLIDFENYEFGEVYDIVEFEFDGVVKMVRSDGYRGNGCYEGVMLKDGKYYYIDVCNCEVEEVVGGLK